MFSYKNIMLEYKTINFKTLIDSKTSGNKVPSIIITIKSLLLLLNVFLCQHFETSSDLFLSIGSVYQFFLIR